MRSTIPIAKYYPDSRLASTFPILDIDFPHGIPGEHSHGQRGLAPEKLKF